MNSCNAIKGTSALTRLDKRPIRVKPNEIIAFACVRNEFLRLPYFLDYHRSLGVNRFIFVDNNSSDETVSFLLSQPDIHVYYTEDSYAAARCGIDWLNELLTTHGRGHWTLTLDADELLIYPMCEDINLRQLTHFLDQGKAQGLATFLLDMYSDKPIRRTIYERGMPFQNLSPFFDADTYHQRNKNGLPVRGGPRHRLFWEGRIRENPSPVLTKIPLVKWREGLEFEASTHVIRNLRLSPLTGVLQHYKFFSDFYTSAEEEVARKEHWDAAAQYESYWRVLGKNPNLSALYDGSIKYEDSSQLVKLNLMKLSKEFEQFVAVLAGKT